MCGVHFVSGAFKPERSTVVMDLADMIVQRAKELSTYKYQLDLTFQFLVTGKRYGTYDTYVCKTTCVATSSGTAEIIHGGACFKFDPRDTHGVSDVLRVAFFGFGAAVPSPSYSREAKARTCMIAGSVQTLNFS